MLFGFLLVILFIIELMGYTLEALAGFQLGRLFQYNLATLITIGLFLAVSMHRAKKAEKHAQFLAQSGLSEYEYILSTLPETIRSYCLANKDNPVLLENYFQQLVSSNIIDQRKADILILGLLGQNLQ